LNSDPETPKKIKEKESIAPTTRKSTLTQWRAWYFILGVLRENV